MSQNNSNALNLEQPTPTPTPSLNQLHHAFAELCHVYGDLNHYYGLSQYVDSKRVDWMQDAIKALSKEVKALRYEGAK
jgi:hypothetical protein